MDINFSTLDYIKNPTNETLKENVQQFLISLKGPTVIDISGQDSTRTRVVVTLLHGNEPSGIIGLHRWLTELNQVDSQMLSPATNMRFIICSTEAATTLPLFTNRYLSGGLDINRCFKKAWSSDEKPQTGYYLRAQLIEQAIKEVNPEAVIDLHNTSGLGPAFTVSTTNNENIVLLTSLFSSTMILSHLSLGALMEVDFGCPVLTVECGGSTDKQAHDIAYKGISLFCSYDFIEDCHHINPVEIIHTPLRLQVKKGVQITFADHNTEQEGVIFCNDLEKFNFGITERGKQFGWINNGGLECLELVDADNEDVITDFFTVMNNQLVGATNIRVFMATPNTDIAKNDCVFYVIKQRDVKTTQLLDVEYIPS